MCSPRSYPTGGQDVAGLAVLALVGGGGDRDQPPALAQRREGCPGLSAEEVEGRVGAAVLVERAHLRRDVLVVVHGLGAGLADEVGLPGEPLAITRAPRAWRELDRDVADAAGPAGDEQRLAAAQPEPLERLVRGQRGQRQRRGLLEGEPFGHVREEALGHGRELGVGAVLELVAAAVAVHGVAGLNQVTAGPTCSTTPAASQPRITGK